MVKDQPSAVPLGLRASMWAGPTVLMAQAELEANVVPAAVEGDKDLADPVEAAEQSLAEGVAGPTPSSDQSYMSYFSKLYRKLICRAARVASHGSSCAQNRQGGSLGRDRSLPAFA